MKKAPLTRRGYLRATLSSRHIGAPKSYSKKDPQVTAGLFLCFLLLFIDVIPDHIDQS